MALNYFELISWFTLLSFLGLYLLPDFRIYLLLFLAFGFGFWLSWSELHTVEVIVLTLIPLFLGVVLLFLSNIFFHVLWTNTPMLSNFLTSAGLGTIILFGFVVLVGIPLSFLAKWVRYALFPVLEEE